jgi:hypothetical protein
MSRRTRIGGQFAPRLIEMLESPAYRALSLSAHRVLNRIEVELAHHGGTNNGKLVVTYENFADYGVSRHAIAPAIREVVALGFVEIAERGRAGNAEYRTPNKYRLTYRHAKGLPGDGTHEWRKTADDVAVAEEIAKTAREQKTFSHPHNNPDFAPRKWGRKPKSPPPEKGGTGSSAFYGGTIDISGWGDASLNQPPQADLPAPQAIREPNFCADGERLVISEHDFVSEDGGFVMFRDEIEGLQRR